MEVISRDNIYRKIALAKEYIKNVLGCNDAVTVLDSVQSSIDKEKVYFIDSEAGETIEVKKCSCGGDFTLKYAEIKAFDLSPTIYFGCNHCNKMFVCCHYYGKIIDLVKLWNEKYADKEVNNE